MSTFRNPVGPQASTVYWRRRLVVGLGLLAVIVIVILIIVRPGSGTPTPTPKADDLPTNSATPLAPGQVAGCTDTAVDIAAVTDKDGYNVGENPQISMTVTNSGATACTLNVGTDVQEYRITSGDEVIWTSKDCQTDSVANPVVLEPGVSQSTTPIAWDRTRSSPDTCDSERPAVTAAGASYHLEVLVGGVESPETKQFLLY